MEATQRKKPAMKSRTDPSRSSVRLVQILLTTALFLALGAAAPAEQFYLAPAGSTAQYGPFEYQEGAPIAIAGNTYVLKKSSTMASATALEKKLQSILLPSVELSGAKIGDVVQFLQMRSVELDPAKKGVHMVLKLNGKPADQIPLISFAAKQISLLEAIRTVTQMTGLSYRLDENIVFIEPK